MRNISSIIASHNKSILHPKAKEYGRSCKNKKSCPLQNQYLALKVIYEVTVVNKSDKEKRVYFGTSDTTFKEQYRNHTRYFNHERFSKCTESSKHIWQLKINKKSLVLNWKMARKVFRNAKNNYCSLCLK